MLFTATAGIISSARFSLADSDTTFKQIMVRAALAKIEEQLGAPKTRHRHRYIVWANLSAENTRQVSELVFVFVTYDGSPHSGSETWQGL